MKLFPTLTAIAVTNDYSTWFPLIRRNCFQILSYWLQNHVSSLKHWKIVKTDTWSLKSNSLCHLLFYYRSELKPVAAPASDDIPENQNQVVAERKKSGGASGISTLFVNLTRKPSKVARNFRKKSKAPPPPTSQPPSNPGPSTSAAEEEGETNTGIFLRYIKRIFLCG